MSLYSLFCGECSVVVNTLYPTMQGSDSQSARADKQSGRAISPAGFSQNGEACAMLFSKPAGVHGIQETMRAYHFCHSLLQSSLKSCLKIWANFFAKANAQLKHRMYA